MRWAVDIDLACPVVRVHLRFLVTRAKSLQFLCSCISYYTPGVVGSAHSSGCVVNGSNAMADYRLIILQELHLILQIATVHNFLSRTCSLITTSVGVPLWTTHLSSVGVGVGDVYSVWSLVLSFCMSGTLALGPEAQ